MQPLKCRDIVIEASGRWRDILNQLGVDAQFLQRGHTACPMCGGKDRYRFTDVASRGNWICNQCGHGDGFDLLRLIFGWDFKHAKTEIERVIGTARLHIVRNARTEAEIRESIRKTLGESSPVSEGDAVWKYLNRRVGIDRVPRDLRFHPSLWHSEAKRRYPAMLAVMRYPDGSGASVHRTYLTADGEKAPVDKVKKLMQGLPINTSCVRLGDVAPVIGVAEGIETALAAAAHFEIPVWAATNAGLLEKWDAPAGIEEVVICADNDKGFTGQAAAFALAKRLSIKGIRATVEVPLTPGTDWADLRHAELVDSPP